jgi:hypothetical protein
MFATLPGGFFFRRAASHNYKGRDRSFASKVRWAFVLSCVRISDKADHLCRTGVAPASRRSRR